MAHSEQTKAKIAAANRGRKHTAETRAKMSAAHLGFQFSEASKQKISLAVSAAWDSRGRLTDDEKRRRKNARDARQRAKTGRTGRTQRAARMRAPMSALAQNHCDACGTTDSGQPGCRFHLDHDHATGLFRGVLCRFCNVTLGSCEKKRERFALIGGGLLAYAIKKGAYVVQTQS